jgi:hypothetical protein
MLGNYKKENRKVRNERRRVCIKWFWTDYERWVCYKRISKRTLTYANGKFYYGRLMIKNQAFLMIQESSDEEIKIMYKKR